METYISMLRGINVSGKNIIKMENLKEMYASLGFKNIQTYVQSGNVIFTSENQKSKELEQAITQQIKENLDLDVPVIVFPMERLEQIINDNPLVNDKNDNAFLHVTFLFSTPQTIDVNTFTEKKLNGEEIYFSQNVVYLYCPNGYGKTKLNNTFLEKNLNVVATTRNWKSTNKLLEMGQKIQD